MKLQSLKVNLQRAGIITLALLCCGCGKDKNKNAPIGTIENVYDGRTLVTDNKGDPIEIARKLEDKYPDLKDYASAEPYRGIYLPGIGRVLDSEKFTVFERNEAYVLIKNDEDKSQFAFGKFYDIHPENKADFRYRTFILKRSEGEYVRFTCHKNRELPQVGDNLRVTMHVKTSVYEDEGLTQVGDYIAIERIA